MSKPYIHSQSSAKHFGGKPDDYIEIHTFLDSSKGAISDNRHRALTHTSWFLMFMLERVKFANSIEAPDRTFPTIKNSDGKIVSIRDIGEQHILEDFRGRFIPTAQDYLQEMEFKDWMNNGHGFCPSAQKFEPRKKAVPAKIPNIILDKPEDIVYDGSRHPIPNFSLDNRIVD